jgi:outer membrane receptor for ferrienterochelin and colicins
MRSIISFCIVMLCTANSYAQHTFKAIVKGKENTFLPGATVSIAAIGRTAVADSNAVVTINNIPSGAYDFLFSYIGYEKVKLRFSFPMTADSLVEITLEEAAEEEEAEVIVTATRISRTIANIPTRIETISGEELEEKGNMKPGDIRMMLNESTGIQTQQTSATSYNSSIRIQGLDGRYTQLLRDGLPLYAGFSGGLSLMQIAPLDLKQVEVIKGSSSTLYGGGAIAGLVNLVSKTPTESRELSFIANVTSAMGLDLSGFYSQRFQKTGITVFGSRNTARAYDPAGIGFTAIPQFERYTINPRMFFYGEKTNINIGVSYIAENRLGGSIDYIKNGNTGYFEKNKTGRFTSQADLRQVLNSTTSLNLKTSFTDFNRLITIPGYQFEATQRSSYSELNLISSKEKSVWIIGTNLITDGLREKTHSTAVLRNYQYTTTGLFLQNTWSPNDRFSLEAGIRGDFVKQYGFEILPRISVMYKADTRWTIRIGGGLGYKNPSLFNEESERMHFRNILPVNQQTAGNERSAGGNLDLNYRTKIGALGISFNQLFFYTRLNRPMVLTPAGSNYVFSNADGFIDTRGLETNLRFTYDDFKLFIGYTFADVTSHIGNTKSWFPLTAKHRLNNVLMFEKEDNIKIGLEAYYFSPQKLTDGTTGQSYWICGIMAEKLWEKFSLFINFENLLDTRQTRFGSIYTGGITNPAFRDIYAPVDGFVINGGIKLKL